VLQFYHFNPNLPELQGDHVGPEGIGAFFESLAEIFRGTFKIEGAASRTASLVRAFPGTLVSTISVVSPPAKSRRAPNAKDGFPDRPHWVIGDWRAPMGHVCRPSRPRPLACSLPAHSRHASCPIFATGPADTGDVRRAQPASSSPLRPNSVLARIVTSL